MTIDLKNLQSIIAYAAIVMGVLTTGPINGITLPHIASAILGVFGVLLHPQTSITANEGSSKPPSAPGA